MYLYNILYVNNFQSLSLKARFFFCDDANCNHNSENTQLGGRVFSDYILNIS